MVVVGHGIVRDIIMDNFLSNDLLSNNVVVVDLYVDHNASGIIVVSNITSEMTPEISEVESTVIHGADCKPHSRY